MASSLFTKLTEFANSPKGQQAIRQAQEKAQQLANNPKVRSAVGTATQKAQQFVNDPRTRARLDEVRRRFQGGPGGPGAGPAA